MKLGKLSKASIPVSLIMRLEYGWCLFAERGRECELRFKLVVVF